MHIKNQIILNQKLLIEPALMLASGWSLKKNTHKWEINKFYVIDEEKR